MTGRGDDCYFRDGISWRKIHREKVRGSGEELQCGIAFECFLFQTLGGGRVGGEVEMMHRWVMGVCPGSSGTLETQLNEIVSKPLFL